MRLSLVWATWPSGLICIVPGAQVVIGLIVALMPLIVDIWLHLVRFGFTASTMLFTGISSQLRAKLRDWAVRPVRAGCYSRAALSLTDSKTRYYTHLKNRGTPF